MKDCRPPARGGCRRRCIRASMSRCAKKSAWRISCRAHCIVSREPLRACSGAAVVVAVPCLDPQLPAANALRRIVPKQLIEQVRCPVRAALGHRDVHVRVHAKREHAPQGHACARQTTTTAPQGHAAGCEEATQRSAPTRLACDQLVHIAPRSGAAAPAPLPRPQSSSRARRRGPLRNRAGWCATQVTRSGPRPQRSPSPADPSTGWPASAPQSVVPRRTCPSPSSST